MSSSPSDFSEFLSRDELLGGLPARRASTLLFAIESRTAQYVSQARQAMVRYRSTRSDEEQERAFLEALAQGRDLPLQPSVQDLERYAPQWAGLVPPEANLRAALARMLGEKYRLPKRSISRLRAALGLDTAEVQAAFERLHARQLESIYTPKLSRRERMRWQQARLAQRLEELPPFWTAFALTLTETVGAGILALPIALATVGPLAGLVVIVVLGLVNVLTLAAICESIARNGNMRYGHVYFGRLVTDYLGRAGNLLLSPALLGLSIIALLATYVGLSSTLDDATGLPAALWMSLMFLAAVWMLRSETLNATVASALIVGFSSISLIVLLSLLALPHLSEDNIRHMQVPFVRGEPWDPGILELIFGVVLLAYFGHTSAGNCAGVVLRREPSGRSFIWGSMAALAVATALYSLWVLAVNGAVAPAALEGQTGTALTPLADVAGAGIYIFGSVFVVLAMGMASLHFSLSLFNQTREWLPAPGGRHGLIDRVVATRRGRLIVGLLPMTAIFAGVQLLFATGNESFSGALGLLGVLTAPIFAGIFPMLLLTAARRKGDYTVRGGVRFLGHPLVAGGISSIFLAAMFLHGAAIWDNPLQQAAAIVVTIVTLVVVAAIIKRGSFDARAVVELRVDQEDDERGVLTVTTRGRPTPAEIVLTYRDGREVSGVANDGGWPLAGLRAALVQVPQSAARELKVWIHRLTPDGNSAQLPARVELSNSTSKQAIDLQAAGYAILPLPPEMHQIEIKLETP